MQIKTATNGSNRLRHLPLVASALAVAVAAGATAALPYAWWRYGVALFPVVAAVVALVAVACAVRQASSAPIKLQVALAISVGVIARVMMTAVVSPSHPANDPLSYQTLSEAVGNGQGLVAWGMRTHYPPLYPLILAGVRLLTGSSILAPLLLNLVIDAASAALVFHLGRKALTLPESSQAAAIFFLWPTFVAASPVAQKESLTILLALAVMAIALPLLGGDRSLRRAAALGGVWGLLATTQPALTPFPLVLLVVGRLGGFISWAGFATTGLISIICAIITLVPWWLRNWLVLGAFVPLTSVGGLALVGVVDERIFQIGRTMTEVAYGRFAAEQAIAWIGAHPVRYLGAVAAQFGRAMLFDIAGIQQYYWFVPPPPKAFSIAVMTFCQCCWIGLWIAVG